MSSSRTPRMRAAAQAAVLGLVFAAGGAPIIAGPAFAQEEGEGTATSTTVTPTYGPSVIDPKHDVSLTLHKTLNPEQVKDPTGYEGDVDLAQAKKLQNVKFKITRLTYDITTNEGLKEARLATVTEARNHLDTFSLETVTDKDGKIKWDSTTNGLKVGAYLVEETDASGAMLDGKPVEDVFPSAPFIVFLPMTNPVTDPAQPVAGEGEDGTREGDPRTVWNYDVVAYPKNTQAGIDKVLTDSYTVGEGGNVSKNTPRKEVDVQNKTTNLNGNVGDKISYDVFVDRPKLNPYKQYFRYFEVYDNVPEFLSWDKTKGSETAPAEKWEPTVSIVSSKTLNERQALVKDTDYVLVYDNAKPEAEPPVPARVRVVLTKEGLDKLTKSPVNSKLKVTYSFTIDGKPTTSFKTINTAGAVEKVEDHPNPKEPPNPNEPPNPDEPPKDVPPQPEIPNEPNKPNIPSIPDKPNEPTTPEVPDQWVAVKILKFAEDRTPVTSSSTAGEGEEGEGSAEGGKKILLQGAEFEVYRCIKQAENTFVHEGDKLTVGGQSKWVTDKDGEALIAGLRVRDHGENMENRGYCLHEVKAPEGYQLLPHDVFVKVTDADDDGGVKHVENQIPWAANVENVPDNGPHLPSAGGMGVGLLLAGGVAIIGAGVYMARRNSVSSASSTERA